MDFPEIFTPSEQVEEVDLLHLPADCVSVTITSMTKSYHITVAPHPESYSEGNRPVVNGLCVIKWPALRSYRDAESLDIQSLFDEVTNKHGTYPDNATRYARRGQPWRVNSDKTGPVQSIGINKPSANLFDGLGVDFGKIFDDSSVVEEIFGQDYDLSDIFPPGPSLYDLSERRPRVRRWPWLRD